MIKQFDDVLLVAEYRKCRRCRIVAEKYGCSDETVRRALIKYGEPRIIRNPREKTKRKATEEELRAIVDEYYATDVDINTLARKHHRAQNTISKAIKEYGHGLKKNAVNARKITDEQILDGIKAGLTRQEIADLYDVHVENLARRMKRLGVHAKYAEAKPRVIFGDAWHYVDSHKKKCDALHKNFEYIESKTTEPKRVRIKCKSCGCVIERATSIFRQKHIRCDTCEEKRKLSESRATLLATFLAIKDYKTPKTCKACGGVFYSPYSSALYCSQKCRRKEKAKKKSYRSRCRKYGVRYDASVTREAVVKRDGYICQICGKPTDPNDREWGTIGPLFPTVDHIVALANGGTHTWDNVQCAHAICNSYKRDLWADEFEEVLSCLA